MGVTARALLIVALAFAACTAQAITPSIEIYPVASSDGVVTRNWSNGVVITVDPAANPLLAAASTPLTYWSRSVIQFPLEDVLSMTSATLWVYVVDASAAATLNYVGAATANGNITYAQATTITAVLGSIPTAAGWVSKDVTTRVAYDLAHGYSWTTYSIIPGADSTMHLGASETASADVSPRLVIQGVLIPEPSSVVALLGGLPLAALWRRRR